MSERRFHVDLPPGTLVRHSCGAIERVVSMHGDFASCHRVKRDGTRDRRFVGWSGSLLVDTWTIVDPGMVIR